MRFLWRRKYFFLNISYISMAGAAKKHQQQTGSRSAFKFSRTESRTGKMQTLTFVIPVHSKFHPFGKHLTKSETQIQPRQDSRWWPTRQSGTCGGLQYFHFHGRPVPASYLPVAAHGQQLSNTTILTIISFIIRRHYYYEMPPLL